ncbi:glycoside hydrolase family 5 protein [Chitinophaga silvatica]|uniref:Glycoside hydrolase family 5 protein n=1 Tax=Chitinophaga silvatica TaxID=2282649 RepID=A0A3E1Y896_9BACT|nr:glycoside hydrolase family 5 protein [Chitinophaga silvatica]RFS21334.1 glycoside hydrolase family 5 protein [Chitinophaga silvatica]
MQKILLTILFLYTVGCSRSAKSASPDTPTRDTVSASVSPVKKHGALHVEGRYLKDQQNNTVVLRGQSLGWSTWWPQYWNADVVNWLADDFKTDIIRAAMGVDMKPGFLNDSSRQLSLLRKVIDGALAKGSYVIIDWHCEPFYQEEAVAFFSAMAKAYGHHPHIMYEIINEPNNTQTWPQVKAYAAAVIAAIRANDPDNIILVGCPNWDQKIKEVADAPLTGYTNIMYTVHFYAATHKQWLRDDCAYALSKNIPIFITECNGSEASGSGHIDYPEWEAWFSFMESNKLSWINWSVSDKANELCSILLPGAPANGNWTKEQLTETGNYIRAKLRSFSTR